MIDHVWTVICADAIIDRDTNLVSLLNVLEQFTIQGEPKPDGILPLKLEVVSFWVRDEPAVPVRGQSRLTFLSPSGEPVKVLISKVDLSQSGRLRTRGIITGLPVHESGRYIFRMELQEEDKENWHEVARIPVEIVFVHEIVNPPLPSD